MLGRTENKTHPEDTDSVVRAVRRAVGLDHTEHTMKLPVDKEHNEQMMRIPKPFKVSATSFLHRVPHHDRERDGHDPPGRAGARGEVGAEEGEDEVLRVVWVENEPKTREVDHVCEDVDGSEENHGPRRRFVEREVLVEGYHRIKCGATEEGNEVAADGEKDECHVDVKDHRARTGNC